MVDMLTKPANAAELAVAIASVTESGQHNGVRKTTEATEAPLFSVES
jgi:hypothetical protein